MKLTDYFTRIQDIVNTYANFGEKILKSNIARKIFTNIFRKTKDSNQLLRKSKHQNKIKVQELVCSLQTHEMTFPSNSSSSKSTNGAGMALKSIKGEDNNLDSDEETSLAKFKHHWLFSQKNSNGTSKRIASMRAPHLLVLILRNL